MTNHATPKTVLPQAMLAQLDLVENNRIALCSSGLEDVLNRDRETRPTAPETVKRAEHPHKHSGLQEEKLEDVRSRARETRPDAPVDVLHACRRLDDEGRTDPNRIRRRPPSG